MRFRLTACFLLTACGAVENMSTTLDMEVDGASLRMNGVINSRALRQFEGVLEDNPHVAEVVLERIEGSLDDSVVVEMGYQIRERGLATRMEAHSEVYSGGVDLFLAGVRRTIVPGAVVGVHEWQNGFGAGRDYPRGAHQHEPTRSYIEDMLGRDDFYWFTLQAAPFEELHVMSYGEIRAFGLVTE